MDPLGQSLKKVLRILAVLIMIQVCAKIGMIQATAFSEIVVFICMTEVTIKQGGSLKKISRKESERDGNVL